MLVQYEYKMKVLYLAVPIISFTLLIFTQNAFASVDLNAYMAINGHPVVPVFKFSKTIYIDYPSGSTLQKELNGKNVTIEFVDDSDHNPSIRSFVQQLNIGIANEMRTSNITNLTVQYETTIHGDDKQATIDYLVTLQPTLANYIIKPGSGIDPAVLDISWVGFSIKNPVIITTKQYGDLEINYPLGVIQNQMPDVYDVLKGVSTEDILNANLLDANPLVDHPIEQWNSLFDPAYTLDDVAGSNYVGQKVPVTGFAYGQSGIYQGPLKSKTTDLDFTADSKYHITIIEKTSMGTIDVEGHANGYSIQGLPAISTTMLSTGFISDPTSTWWVGMQGFILWFVVAGAGMVIFWALFFRRFRE